MQNLLVLASVSVLLPMFIDINTNLHGSFWRSYYSIQIL